MHKETLWWWRVGGVPQMVILTLFEICPWQKSEFYIEQEPIQLVESDREPVTRQRKKN